MIEKDPFSRNLLRGLNEERYVEKMEDLIVEEGKRLLNSLKISYRIVSQKNITKFLDAHKEFKDAFNKKTIWHQIRLQRLLDTKVINSYQYQILSMMRQILNKHSVYILRGNEFENHIFVMNCMWYSKTKKCLRDGCKASECCPHYHKNFETKYLKQEKLYKEKQKRKQMKKVKNEL